MEFCYGLELLNLVLFCEVLLGGVISVQILESRFWMSSCFYFTFCDWSSCCDGFHLDQLHSYLAYCFQGVCWKSSMEDLLVFAQKLFVQLVYDETSCTNQLCQLPLVHWFLNLVHWSSLWLCICWLTRGIFLYLWIANYWFGDTFVKLGWCIAWESYFLIHTFGTLIYVGYCLWWT